ncbi:MAG: FAD-dependent monooxygenase, partial [Flavobacteriales bacterium]
MERTAVYTFQSVVANNWRKDRLLIAGDAAHLTPPFMGQGMCAGIRDAANLAWKLALCIKGAANEDILDSYQQERSPHVRAFIEMAIRLGGLINTIDSRTALAQAE